MSDSVNRDVWLKWKPVVKTDLINQKITIPAFSYPSGELNASLKFSPSLNLQANCGITGADITTAITLEAWAKINADYGTNFLPIFKRTIAGGIDPQWEFGLYGSKLYLKFRKGGLVTTYVTVESVFNIGEWNHVAWSWDGVTARPYVNGVALTTGPLVAPVDGLGGGGASQMIGYTFGIGERFQGNLNEIRVWDIGRTQQQILASMFAPRNLITGDNVDDNLRFYFKCKDSAADGSVTDSKNPAQPKMKVNAILDTTDFYPMKYGASFVVAKFTVDLGKKCSLKFPITVDDPNHSLVVRWTDADGNSIRRWFYKPDGVDYDEGITEYNGECINNPFDLEIWNIDGKDIVSLSEELNLGLSLTSLPTSPIDIEPLSAATLAVDTTLAQNFPLVFPLTFNSQQQYIVP